MTSGRHIVSPGPVRKAIARRMVASKTTAPHFYVTAEIGMDELLEGLAAMNAEREAAHRITVTAALVRATALALVEHADLNAVWAGDYLERWEAVNVGVAITLDEGLIAPALLDCANQSVDQLAESLKDLVARSKAGRLRPPEISEATFTLSNLGMFEVSAFTAIITPPQVAILATARTEPRVVVEDGEVVIRRRMTVVLSADHRVTDGVGGARFLATFKGLLESPSDWLDA